MKKQLLTVTSTAFALGIAFSAQADVQAASPNASVKAQGNGAASLERLNPVENRLSSVDRELEIITDELEGSEALSPEQYDYYEGKLDSLNNRVDASANQLDAVLKKVDDDAEEVEEIENTVDETLTNVTEVQETLNTIEVLPEESTEEPSDESEDTEEGLTTDQSSEDTEETLTTDDSNEESEEVSTTDDESMEATEGTATIEGPFVEGTVEITLQ